MTWGLFAAIAAVCLFMVLQDIFGTGLTISESRALKVFPGLFDGLGDFASRYGGAIGAVTAVHYGVTSWQFLAVTSSCAGTSYFTSNAATGKVSAILPKDRLESFTLSLLWQRLKGA
jgi:hypothetical protein